MNNLDYRDLFIAVKDYDTLLFDIWGVIVEGNYIYPGTVETINKLAQDKTILFVSNVPRSRAYTYEMLGSWGIKTRPEMIITAGEVARQLITTNLQNFTQKPAIYHLGADRNHDMLADLNLPMTDNIHQANILALSLYRDEGDNLEEFDDFLKTAAAIGTVNICANPDTTIPRLGSMRYCAGYFAAKLEKFGAPVIYTGKPYAEIYQKAFELLPGMEKRRVLMIGDTLETDILGANNIGIDSALVLTGNAKKFHTDHSDMVDKLTALSNAANRAGVKPTFVTRVDIVPSKAGIRS